MVDIPWDLSRDDEFHVRVRNRSETPKYFVSVTGPQVRAKFEWDVFDAGATKVVRVLAGDDAGPEIDIVWFDTPDSTGEPRRWQDIPRLH